jgi:hypothetical protein
MRMDSSGDRNTREPSTGEANDAVLGDLAPLGQREHLESAGIGKDRFVPADELVQPAEFSDYVETRSQEQVKRVAEDDSGAHVRERLRRHRLDRAVRANWHERRSLDRAARKRDAAAARGTVCGHDVEPHPGHIR